MFQRKRLLEEVEMRWLDIIPYLPAMKSSQHYDCTAIHLFTSMKYLSKYIIQSFALFQQRSGSRSQESLRLQLGDV